LKFAELELELKPQGTKEDLANLAARVQAEWNLAPEAKSKFERALALVDEAKAAPPKRRRRVPRIRLDDTMATAARKTLLLHWGRMLDHEAGARAGADIEQVHDMRVATRRMRAAFRIFADYLDDDAFKPFAKMLRRTARTLGAVRDLDVFREKAQHYLDTLPDERKSELDLLLAAWQTEYQRARGELMELFDSDAYARVRTAFEKFLRTPGAGAAATEMQDGEPIAQRVRDVLPIMLLRGWAIVRAYDASVSAPDVPLTRLHQLRIASKGLRYTLEFFADVMNPETQSLIEQMKQLQDHLGTLQDAVVACNILYDFLTWGEWSRAARRSLRRPRTLIVAPGVAAYLAVRQNEIRELVQTFPQVWLPISQPEFRRQLLALMAAW
jgi:CHAD domain-containing protein